MLTDSHIHLYLSDFDNDFNKVLNDAKKNKINRFLLPNIDKNSLPKLLSICKENKHLYPMIGLHPVSVKENYLSELDFIYNFIDGNDFIAIGEIGIDLYWDKSFLEQQKHAFKLQINWGKKHNLPIVIHSRNSFNEVFQILKDEKSSQMTGIFHCFSGTYEEAKKIIDLGFYLGIGGVVTFKNSELKNVLKKIDLKHIVLETDAPYLAPHPFRGQRNEPKYLSIIANQIAEIKNTTIEEVALITSHNTNKIFFC